jgi:predicted histone-like DNA-binding protein
MSINYEIHTISNSQGSGTARHFARIFEGSPMSAQQLEHLIQDNSTLKKGDIEATLSELREQMVRELSQGHRFYIPNVGYFSLSVKLDADGKAVEKVSSGDLRLHNINFRPEASLLQEVGSKVRFRRARLTSKSVVYEEKQQYLRISVQRDSPFADERVLLWRLMRGGCNIASDASSLVSSDLAHMQLRYHPLRAKMSL